MAMRGGWSVVALDGKGRRRWTKKGTLGGLNITSHRAEVRAVLETLKVAAPPLRIHTDSQCVIDGLARGRAWCTNSKSADADLWRGIWDLVEVACMDGEVDLVKVKAHTGWAEILSRRISPMHQFGNWLADAAAKSCAKYSEAETPTASFRAEVRKAVAWLRWAGRYSAEWINDVEPVERAIVPSRTGNSIDCEFGESHLKHELWALGKRAVCRRCALARPNPELQDQGISWRCEGSAAGRAASKVTGNINHIWARYAIPRGELVRRGARLVAATPPPRWLVDISSLQDAADDEEHLRTLRSFLRGAARS